MADVGLAYITRNFARQKHAFVWSDFISTIRKNWKQALPIGIINLAITALLFWDVEFYAENTFMMAVALMLLLVFSFMQHYMPLMIITFKLSWKQLYKNAAIFAFVGIFRNLLITVIKAVPLLFVRACLVQGDWPFLALLVALYLLILPSFQSFLTQFAIFPLVKKHMIDPYYEAHPNEDAQQKQALNIEHKSEEPKNDEDVVFRDMGRTDSYLGKDAKERDYTIPKQYSEREMRRFQESKRRARHQDDADDDGTI